MPKPQESADSAPTAPPGQTIPESPWDRIKDPVPVPEPCTAVVLRLLTDEEFALLLRSHLVPGPDRSGFQQLWIVLAFNDDLADRAFDILEEWLEVAEQHLRTGPQSSRARKFRGFCDGAWNRLTKIRQFDTKEEMEQPAPHTTAGHFALAIHRHQQACAGAATAVDQALWAALNHARDRANRGKDTTKGWAVSPTFTSQLIDAVRDHRRLTDGGERVADAALWGLLR